MHITQVMVGYTCSCARAYVPPFPHFGNGWTDWAEIWFVIRDPLAWRFTKVNGGVQVRVRTRAAVFRISGTAGRIALKRGMWLQDHWLCTLHGMGGIRTNARVTVHTFKHICLLPIVHRPKGVLLVVILVQMHATKCMAIALFALYSTCKLQCRVLPKTFSLCRWNFDAAEKECDWWSSMNSLTRTIGGRNWS